MKLLKYFFAIIIGISSILVLFITAFEIAAYSDFKWYEKEYAKYEVLPYLEMEMEDVMDVTKEMMSYLKNDRDDLVVHTVVNGYEREFFNDREKLHMEDVKDIFMTALWIRRIALMCLSVAVGILIAMKADWKKIIPKSFLISITVLLVSLTGIGILVMQDFTKYFKIFHKIFFDNNLWILYPETDLLIRMLPEGFFLDMVIRIGIVLGILLLLNIVISVFVLIKQRHKKN